jgi:hypothetical protein
MDAAVHSAITHLLAAVPTLDANEASSALEVAVPTTGVARRDSWRNWSHTCPPTPTRWAPAILVARRS